MFIKFWFRQLSLARQENFMRKRGIMLGTRKKNGRQVYTYMFRDLFADVVYKEDKLERGAEDMKVIDGLKKLNHHLEKEIKSV